MNKRNINFPSTSAVKTVASDTTTYSFPVKVIPQQVRIESYDYMTAIQIKDFLGVSRSKAYDIVRELNEELAQMGKLTLAGKVPKKLLLDRLYPQITA